jgi:hypothetical protein
LRLAATARRFARQTDKVRQRGSRRLGGGDADRQHGRKNDQGARRQLHVAIPPWIESRPSGGLRKTALSLLAAPIGAGGADGVIDRTALLGKSKTSGMAGTDSTGVKVRQLAEALSLCAG